MPRPGRGGHFDGKFANIDGLAIDGGLKAHVHSMQESRTRREYRRAPEGTRDVGRGKREARSYLTMYGLPAGFVGLLVGRLLMNCCIGLVVGIEVGRISVTGGA